MNASRLLAAAGFIVPTLAGAMAHAGAEGPVSLSLRQGWSLRSSCEVEATGAEISTAGFKTPGWHATEVPSTVVGALVADKTYPDPLFGMNLRSLPGMGYPIGRNFSNLPMPADSPFHCPWWYRTEFRLPAGPKGRTWWLRFDGINYRANVWLNGQKIADAKDVKGTFRTFEFDVTGRLRADAPNALAVDVAAPGEKDLALTWVDWNPSPPDKSMGLWKGVSLRGTGVVAVRHPFVVSKLDPERTTAGLGLSVDLKNAAPRPVKGTLRVEIEGIRLLRSVDLGPSETKTVSLKPDSAPELKLVRPRLWWPHDMGTPELYTATVAFETGGGVSDAATLKFGVRDVTVEANEIGARLFRINGRKVLVRGGGWSSDILLRSSPERLESELRYTRDLGLNTIRLEGKLEHDEFFDLADRLGLLVMPGWCCCDMWEHWKQWTPESHEVAGASLADQVRRLRSHPSVFVWLYGSDGPPPADVEAMYLKILKDLEWPNPSLSSASAEPTTLTGPSGVKMTGPYDYVPPSYWLVDKKLGGAHGFNTETGPGPAIPPLESLKRFLPADHLWPIDEQWSYHAGGSRFQKIDLFTGALAARYGPADSLEDFLRKSEAMAYEGQRAMFEAYSRNKYVSTGVVQWMLNNAWPSLIWHLYDYYLVPAGGYFGTKKAHEPAHVQYSYDDHSVAVVNGFPHALPGLQVTARLYDLDAREIAAREAKLDAAPDSSTRVLALPDAETLPTTYFLRLQLRDASRLLSDNFYWLSARPDVMDWEKTKGTAYTPQSAFADLTGLARLPRVRLALAATVERDAHTGAVHATLRNPGPSLAFMVRLRLTKGKGGEDVTPVFWDDNYVSLLPGEERTLTVRYDGPTLEGKEPVVEVGGWNVDAVSAGAAPR
jgi:exo-1,4-beta-D-glucosaminidase